MPLFQKHSNPEAALLGLLKQLGSPVNPIHVMSAASATVTDKINS
jgi:hypothetical protein